MRSIITDWYLELLRQSDNVRVVGKIDLAAQLLQLRAQEVAWHQQMRREMIGLFVFLFSDQVVYHLPVRILGFKPARFRQWKALLLAEGRRSGYWSLALHIVKSIITGRFVGRKEWRRRMRACGRCPVFDRNIKRCGQDGYKAGCRCYTPFLALAGRCWLVENVQEADRDGHGW